MIPEESEQQGGFTKAPVIAVNKATQYTNNLYAACIFYIPYY